jgi:hypothetical protein
MTQETCFFEHIGPGALFTDGQERMFRKLDDDHGVRVARRNGALIECGTPKEFQRTMVVRPHSEETLDDFIVDVMPNTAMSLGEIQTLLLLLVGGLILLGMTLSCITWALK